MTSIYLKRIKLTQFRNFANLDVALEPEPGVMVVHGTNGLGKSSLFDGLEWTLTDEIDHFRAAAEVDKRGAYLCRWRKGNPGPTSVAMTFSDDHIIGRQLLSNKAQTSSLIGDVDDIIGYLQSPGWRSKIDNIQPYLLLTHFLGQSTLSRMTHRDPRQRFDILKEAAQSKAIEATGAALHGDGTSAMAKAYLRQIAQLKAEIAELERLLDQEGNLWNDAQTAGAINDEDFDAQMAQLAARLETIDITLEDDPELDRRHTTLRGMQAWLDGLTDEIVSLEGLRTRANKIFADHQKQVLANVTTVGMQEELGRQQAELAATLKVDEARRAEYAADLADKVEALKAATAKIEALFALQTNRERYHERAKRIVIEQEQLVPLAINLAEAEIRLRRVRRRRQIINALVEQIRGMQVGLGQLQQHNEATRHLIELGRRGSALCDELERLEAVDPHLEAKLKKVASDLELAEERVRTETALAQAMGEAAGAVSAAVATIAGKLPEDACACPVCDTRFVDSMQLRSRLEQAANRFDPALRDQDRRKDDAIRERDTLMRQYDLLLDVQGKRETLKTELEAVRHDRQGWISRSAGQESESLEEVIARHQAIERDLEQVERKIARKIYWRNHSSLKATEGELESLQRERDLAQLGYETQIEHLADLRSGHARSAKEIGDAQAALSLSEPLIDEKLGQMIEDSKKALEDASIAEAKKRQENSNFESYLGHLRARLASLDAQLDAHHATTRRSEDMVERLMKAWQALSVFGDIPDESVLLTFQLRLDETRSKLAEVGAHLSRLREGRTAWGHQQSHRSVLEDLRKLVDGSPNVGRDVLRVVAHTHLEALGVQMGRVERAQRIAKAASVEISAKLNAFNAAYIKPLSALMDRINRSILCDDTVGINLRVTKRKIEQKAIKRKEDQAQVGKLDPQLVHSEGQMAALGVSMLTAASLTFPWSRWRALILDDPLQHNDAIHASAFADLVSNLVKAEGYQILLTTHDLGQAEFLQRKFRANRVPCTLLSLLGTGRDGVISAQTGGFGDHMSEKRMA